LLRPVIQFKPIEGDGALAEGNDRDAGTNELIEEILVHPQVRGSCSEANQPWGKLFPTLLSRQAHCASVLRIEVDGVKDVSRTWDARVENVTNSLAYECCGPAAVGGKFCTIAPHLAAD